jgi:hypothetical protein
MADDGTNLERAAKTREAIDWCKQMLHAHGQAIGTDAAWGSLKSSQTASALAQKLVPIGLADHASMLPLRAYQTHQDIVGLLNRYVPILEHHAQQLAPPIGPARLARLPAQQVALNAAMAREAADWCKTQAGGIRALLRFSDVPPQSCRNVIAALVQILSIAGQSALLVGVDLTSSNYDNPMPVIGLLAQVSTDLERIVSKLESPPSHDASPPLVDQPEYLSPAQVDILVALLKARTPLKKEQLAAAVGLKEPHGSFGRDLKRLKTRGLIDNRRHGYFLTERGAAKAGRRAE